MAQLNPNLARLLELLEASDQVAVESTRQIGSTLIAELSSTGNRASVVANADLPPQRVDGKGRRSFGAYTILDDGYGDWIKGGDATECAAYIIAWLVGRRRRRGTEAPSFDVIDIRALGHEGVCDDPDLDTVSRELQARSSLREVSPGRLETPDGQLSVLVRLQATDLAGAVAGLEFVVEARSDRHRAAGILGFVDGATEGSDE